MTALEPGSPLGLPELLDLAGEGVIVQGITGTASRRHALRMCEYGTNVVAGVVPGRGGEQVEGIPVFDTVQRAVDETGALTVVAFLPPAAAEDGLAESAEAGIRLVISVTEGVDLHKSIRALEAARLAGMRVIGPNTAGVMVPEQLLLGFLPVDIARPGSVAVISRSGTLSYEVIWSMSNAGFGQRIWLSVGGDEVKGTSFADVIPGLAKDPSVKALILVGEIGGADEQEAASLLATYRIPTVALVAGRAAPAGVPMGHAGALVEDEEGSWERKTAVLKSAGIRVADSPSDVVANLRRLLD